MSTLQLMVVNKVCSFARFTSETNKSLYILMNRKTFLKLHYIHIRKREREREHFFGGFTVCKFLVASINAEVGGRLRKGSCYKIADGPTKSQNHTWFQLTHRCWNEVRGINQKIYITTQKEQLILLHISSS